MIDHLPPDWRQAHLLGRIALPEGPTPVLVRQGRVFEYIAEGAGKSRLQLTEGCELVCCDQRVDVGVQR